MMHLSKCITKGRYCPLICVLMSASVCASAQSFRSLPHKPLSVDLTVEEGQRLKVIYGSLSGFHAIDVDSGTPYDLYLPTHVRLCLLQYKLLFAPHKHMIYCLYFLCCCKKLKTFFHIDWHLCEV